MTNKNTESDNWGQLLSEFGIDDQTPEDVTPPETPEAIEPTEPFRCSARRSSVSPEPIPSGDSTPEIADEPSAPKEKKSIFSRFPKMPFFGAPPEVSLDSVIEGVKSPSLGGKAFTDNKMEKMPVSQERTDRHKKNRREENESTDEPNAWSAVASQIDALASGGDLKPKSGRRSAKHPVSSMFDDPVPESEESRALKDLMGEQPNRREPRRDVFLEEEPDSRQRGRGRRTPQSEEKEGFRGRGSRYRSPVEVDDMPESDFEPMEDEVPKTRGSGRRGPRYPEGNYRDRGSIRDDAPQEEWSEVDAALQAGRNDFPTRESRGGRRQRYDKRRGSERMEESRMDQEPLNEEDSGIAVTHGNIPSWDDAIGSIIKDNISKHRGHSHSGRGRR